MIPGSFRVVGGSSEPLWPCRSVVRRCRIAIVPDYCETFSDHHEADISFKESVSGFHMTLRIDIEI